MLYPNDYYMVWNNLVVCGKTGLVNNYWNDGYVNNQVCPCIFIQRSPTVFVIIVVYVDDLNIVGTFEDITNAINHLKNEFWNEKSSKDKILFRYTGGALIFRHICLSIKLHWKGPWSVLRGQSSSTNHANGLSITRGWKGSLPS